MLHLQSTQYSEYSVKYRNIDAQVISQFINEISDIKTLKIEQKT